MLTFNENSLNEMFGTIAESVYAAGGCPCRCVKCTRCVNPGGESCVSACRGCSVIPSDDVDWDNL